MPGFSIIAERENYIILLFYNFCGPGALTVALVLRPHDARDATAR
jgi:hypothetical protein